MQTLIQIIWKGLGGMLSAMESLMLILWKGLGRMLSAMESLMLILWRVLGATSKRLVVEVLGAVMLLAPLSLLWNAYHVERAQRIRLTENQGALLTGMQTYRVADSLQAVHVGALRVTVQEFREQFSSTQRLLRDMGIKLHRLQSVATLATQMQHPIEASVKDSVVGREVGSGVKDLRDVPSLQDLQDRQGSASLQDLQALQALQGSEVASGVGSLRDNAEVQQVKSLVQTIHYQDRWLTLNGIIQNRQFTGHVQSRDTLIQAIHRVPRTFLFLRYGTKSIRQDILSKNPYTKITYSEYLQFDP